MRLKTACVIAAVVAMALVVFALAPGAMAAGEAEYVGHQACKVCHNKKGEGAQWSKWDAAPHSEAFEKLQTDEAKQVAEKAGVAKPPSEAPECLRCHVTAYDAKTGTVPEKIDMKDGVQCETCHGPASLHVAAAKKAMVSKDENADLGQYLVKPKIVYMLGDQVVPEGGDTAEAVANCELCTSKCHNPENPTWDPDRYTLPDGSKAGFYFPAAWGKISHARPEKEE